MPISVADALTRQHTPSALKLFEFLNNAPIDQLYDTTELLAACEIGETTLRRVARECDLEPYRTTYGTGSYYWGNRDAIQAYIKGRE